MMSDQRQRPLALHRGTTIVTRGRGAKIFTIDGQFGFMEIYILSIRCFPLRVT